jgi:endonuclease/exonuclease/phosphatase family metal-dependent hydrolase
MTHRPRLTRRRIVLAGVLLVLLLPLALFVINGMLLAWNETPRAGTTSHPAAPAPVSESFEVKVMAYNIAKAFVHKGGVRFEDRAVVEERVGRLADVINAERPYLLFLSEVVVECGPCPVNQRERLAERTGMHAWVFGENYNFGLPFYRIVGGNAILSRRPLEAVANPSLAGRQPFYITKNNRRALWATGTFGGERVLLASLHNDSFDARNNLRQMQQILDYAVDQPLLLAGDFNAEPGSPSTRRVQESGRFSGAFEGPETFPSGRPDRRIDFILAPESWQLIEDHVPVSEASDHRPVVATFRVPSG